jgi:hypothetical protein
MGAIAEGYKLVQRIGAGTFGEVWRAEAPGGVEVAVKVIFRPIADQEVKRELEALDLIKRLRHPYLLQTHAYWLTNDRLHIAIELADASLADRLKECRKTGQAGIPPAELLRYFHEAAEALDYLHGARVLHRDVKPENILLLKRHAKVADFGLARLLQPDRASVSASGAGTPRYMAPEVWQNRATPSSDQYSLALSYLELLLGRHVKEGGNMLDWMYFHVQETPDCDVLADPDKQVVLRALAKEPGKRFPTCLAFIDALAAAGAVSGGGVFTSAPAQDGGHAEEMMGTAPAIGSSPRERMPQSRLPAFARASIAVPAPQPHSDTPGPDIPAVRRTVVSSGRRRLVVTGILFACVVLGSGLAWWYLREPAWLPSSFVVEPVALTIRVGESKPVDLRVRRHFLAAPIALSFDDIPVGVRVEGTTIGADRDSASLVLQASPEAAPGNHRITVRAMSDGVSQQGVIELTVEPAPPPPVPPGNWPHVSPGYERAPGAAVVKDADGRLLYDRIVAAPPDGLSAEFVLIRRNSSAPTDPPTFYIMVDKVTVRQFRAFAQAKPDQVSSREWEKGGKANSQDTRNANDVHPVFRVTAGDANHFARWLGGTLPTARQWDKAAGRFEENPGEGPYRGTWDGTDNRHLAVNRRTEGPLPAGQADQDVSHFGCRDMAGNGREWTCDGAGPDGRVWLRGRSYTAAAPLCFADLTSDGVSAQFAEVASPFTSFRVVVEIDKRGSAPPGNAPVAPAFTTR